MKEKDKTAVGTAMGPEGLAGGEYRPWLKRRLSGRIDDAVVGLAGRLTGGLPAPRIGLAYLDWYTNLALSPGRQLEIAEFLLRSRWELLLGLVGRAPPLHDPRYSSVGWQRPPYAWLARAALKREALWKLATEPLPGVARHNAELVHFYTMQLVEACSPQNFPLTNGDVAQATIEQRGRNLVRGARNAVTDLRDRLRGRSDSRQSTHQVGKDLAVTPGKVVYRNRLMELIQYSPATAKVYAEPVLIVPAWIMKYYILDLSQQNSMVRWLVAQGHTVFIISWKNPDEEDRDISMDDYRTLGVLAALDAVTTIVPGPRVHAVGYCVGGTLLSIVAAAMARDGDHRLQSVTLLAAQTDFEDAGELKLFIDEMALQWLDGQMARRGFLDTKQMGGAFGMLRARDLIWGPIVREYWLGERSKAFDIMAWNADGTRMPFRMHSDYLRQLYLENRLAQGKYRIGGKSVSIGDIRAPLFVVGTATDHVAPWKSVYKIRNLKRLGETTFALTNGGHNAGIVSEPGRPRRKYHLGSWNESTAYQGPEEWLSASASHEGSWWTAWQRWLVSHSSADQVAPPEMGDPESYPVLGEAPGTYVFQS